MFVFTATASSTEPKSPDYVKSKLKGVGVSLNLLPEEINWQKRERRGKDELAQQLELGGSDKCRPTSGHEVNIDYLPFGKACHFSF